MNRLRRTMNAAMAGGGAAAIPHPALPGILRWYDASLLTDSPVSSWEDSAGIQEATANAGEQPLLSVGALNGRSVVVFDGSNDFMDFGSLTTIKTAALVVKHATGNQAYTALLGDPTSADFHGEATTGLVDPTYCSPKIDEIIINGKPFIASNALKPTSFGCVVITNKEQDWNGFNGWTAQYIGNDRNAANRYWNGSYAEIVISSSDWTLTELTNFQNYVYTKYGITQDTSSVSANRIVFDGDSMTSGYLTSDIAHTYPSQCIALLTGTWRMVNSGLAGATLTSMIGDAPAQIDSKYHANYTKNIVVIFVGSNDLAGGASATTAEASLITYLNSRKAVGWKTVVLTMLPRSNVGTPVGFEAQRQLFNTWLVANWATYADALADVAADSRIGDAGDEEDTTYYADLVHMTDAGYAIVAGIVKTAIETL